MKSLVVQSLSDVFGGAGGPGAFEVEVLAAVLLFNEDAVPERIPENRPPHASSSFPPPQILPSLSLSNIEYFEISNSSIFAVFAPSAVELNEEVDGATVGCGAKVGGAGALGLYCPNARRSSKSSFRFETILLD